MEPRPNCQAFAPRALTPAESPSTLVVRPAGGLRLGELFEMNQAPSLCWYPSSPWVSLAGHLQVDLKDCSFKTTACLHRVTTNVSSSTLPTAIPEVVMIGFPALVGEGGEMSSTSVRKPLMGRSVAFPDRTECQLKPRLSRYLGS